MKNLKILVFILAFLSVCPAFALFKSYPTGATDNAPVASEEELNKNELHDILQPFPETERERKKREKREKKIQKQKAKAGNDLSKKKRKRKYTYNEVKRENKAPKTFEEYVLISKEKKRYELDVKDPEPYVDEKLEPLPAPEFRLKKYNNPPGSVKFDLKSLPKNGICRSVGVLSPDGKRIVFTETYLYPGVPQMTSALYVYEVKEDGTAIEKLKKANNAVAEFSPLTTSGMTQLFKALKKTLTILDWSDDGTKIAVKETTGSVYGDSWKTQIIVYDFTAKKTAVLNALPEAVRYYWKETHNIDLNDYLWDIYPLGWDAKNPERIIVYAYAGAKNGKQRLFLGTWSIDTNNMVSQMLSPDKTNYDISINGLILERKQD